MKKNKIFSVFKYLFFLSCGIGLLWYVTQKQDINKLILEFKTANYFWIVLAMSMGGLSHVARAARWNMIIESMGHKTKLSHTFYAVMIGYFANMLVPRLGEVSRCGVLSKNGKIPFTTLLGTVVAERIFDAFCLLFLTFLVVIFQFRFLKEFLSTYIFEPLSLNLFSNYTVLLLVLILIIVFIVGLYIVYKMTNKRLKKKPTYLKFRRVMSGFSEGIKAIAHIQNKGAFLLHTLFIWFMYFLMTYLCFFSLEGTSHLTTADGLTILIMGSIGIVAPVPGGIGAYHFIVILTLTELYGINATSATSFAYISHASQGALITLLGIISFAFFFLLNKKAKRAAEQEMHNQAVNNNNHQ